MYISTHYRNLIITKLKGDGKLSPLVIYRKYIYCMLLKYLFVKFITYCVDSKYQKI